jgi:hypothetical protein
MVTVYKVRFSLEAETSLRHVDRRDAQRILDRIRWLSLHVEEI